MLGCPEGYRSMEGDISGGIIEQYQGSLEECKFHCDENKDCKTFRHVVKKVSECTLISIDTPNTIKIGNFKLCTKGGNDLFLSPKIDFLFH